MKLVAAFVACLACASTAAAQSINLGTFSGQVFAQLSGSSTFALQPGSTLPPGLNLVTDPDLPTFFPSTVHAGIIGIPTSVGTSTFSLLRDGVQQSYTIRISRLNIKDNWALPDATRNQAYSYQLTALSPANTPAWTATAPLPSGLTLSSSGLLSGTPTVAGTFSIAIRVNDGIDNAFRTCTLKIDPIAITPASLPNALQNATYGVVLTASGGLPPYTFTADGLPDGLFLLPTGSLTGTPTGSGHWWFNLTATDAAHAATTKVMSLVTVGVPPQLPQIAPYDHEIHDCSLGAPCVQAVSVDGGRAPYTWTASGLPPGMDVRSGHGVTSWIAPDNLEIWGTPTAPGDFNLQLTVTDADGQSATNAFPFRVRALDLDYLENPMVGAALTHHYQLWGGQPPFTMTLVQGRLPLGLTFDAATHTVSGTPLEGGDFNVVFDVRDANGIELRRYNFFTVGTASTVRILDSAEDDGLLAGQPIVYQLPACCATSYVWSVDSGTPPPGLDISPTGLITGTVTPGTAGRFTFVLRVRDGANPTQTSIRQFSLIVTSLDVTSNLPFGNVGVPYSGSVSATGAAGITWMLEPFRYLPPGLTLQSSGAISGTPTSSGRYPFALRTTDTAGSFASWGFTIDIYPPGATPPAGPNSAPVSSPVVLAVEEGTTPKSGTLLATDPDGDVMTFSVVDQPDKGTIVLDDPATGAFTYTPDGDAVGYDTFTFRATDPTGASSTALASVFIVAGSPRWPGQTVRLNVAHDGTEADGPSTLGAAVSADGRFVAFASAATTLAPNIPPGSVNVYLRDRQTGQIGLVSVGGAGGPAIGGALPSISPDGRHIVFAGLSSALPGGVPNNTSDVYLYDRQTGQTERISVSSSGTAGNQESVFGTPSADGRYVAFYGSASNLVPGDTNGAEDVFLRDRQTGRTTRVSVTSTGAQGDDSSWRSAMSADGRFIAFNSAATNLTPNDTNGATDVFVRDVWTGQTTRVSVASDGTQSDGGSEVSGISTDGRFVVFSSSASNLVSGDTNGLADVFVHDRQTGQTTRVSVSGSGIFGSGVQGNGDSTEGTISADGRYVAFRSWASNLVPNDTNGVADEFVRDLRTGQLLRVNIASDGTQANAASIGDEDGCCITPTISADGRSIVIFSTASNLVPDDTNGTDDVFVVGPVSVFPPIVDVPAAGGARSVDASFDYPGTPWTASTTTPWITIAPPANGSASGTVNFTVAPNAGPFRSGTITVALQTVTVIQQAGSATALTVADGAGTFGGTTTLTATLTNGGFAFAGQLVSFSLNGNPVGTATTNPAGIATLSLVSLAGINAGVYPAGVQATYAGDDVHVPSSGGATLSVGKVFPTIAWTAPAGIVVGTPLSSIQLNATASVPGTFAYTPPFGTVLPVGGSEILSATFTPTDTVNYQTVAAQTTIDVNTIAGPFTASFHAIGDLSGGPFVSAVRDATRVGGVLYAVGASASHNQVPCTGPNNPVGCVTQFSPDTAVLWTFDGTSSTLTPLPDLATPTGTPVNPLFASAITRNGAYIASGARSNAADPFQELAVRVTRSGLVNLNLSAAPFPPNGQPAAAQAISEDGSVLYGVDGVPFRARRFDVNASTSVQIPLLSGSDTASFIAGRGVSFDGSVMVGTSFVFPFTGTNGRAFRYVHSSPAGTVSAIPLLSGGTWNRALAVSPDGRRVLVAGNSTSLPNGEIYFYDAVTGTTTSLGSPNTPWAPTFTENNFLLINFAGMTADGSVVAATFADATDSGPARHGHGYIHNARGWFHLTTVLGERGIDIQTDGWDSEHIQIDGISPDGTLVFGSGLHNGNVEGFVAEFSPGYLSAFDFPAVAPTDTSIVGVWTRPGDPSPVVFLADGTYFSIDPTHGTQIAGENTSGFERGRYRWDASAGALTFATLQDTNGSVGLSGGNGFTFPASLSGDTLSLAGGDIVVNRVAGTEASVVGGWVSGDPRISDSSAVLVLLSDGTFQFADDGNTALDPLGHDGIEAGSYSFNPNGTLTLNVTIDTDGEWGFADGPGIVTATLPLIDGGLHLGQPGDPHPLTRIVDPQAVVPAITSPLSASGRAGRPFSYAIAATWTHSFNATGLPVGLGINTSTGVIAGTPTVAGDFVVAISATSVFNSTSSASLTISLAPAVVATTLTAANASGTFGGTTTLSATLTGDGGPLFGQQVSFALNGTSVGTATTNGAGLATLTGVSLAGIGAGTYATAVQATYAGDTTHAPATTSAALTVAKAVPVITWLAPAPIAHNTSLSVVQLNASASVPGTFVYLPAAGAMLPIGPQPLSTTFTPADTADYATATAQVTITVTNAPPTARNVAIATTEATAKNGTLVGIDFENDPLTFTITASPSKGTLTLLDPVTGAFTFTPDAGALGYDTFTFGVTDAGGASSTGTGMVFIVAATSRWPGQTIRANVSSAGAQTDSHQSFGPSLSADGRYIAFASSAGTLVPGDTSTFVDVFVRDRQTGITTQVSAARDGSPANGDSQWPAISADGHFIVFASSASNLVAGDTNGVTDMFVFDRQAGQTTRISVSSTGSQSNDVCFGPAAISADGRYVAYWSNASNLVPNDTNARADVFVFDRTTGNTSRVSVASDGSQGNSDSFFPSISADGRYVAFESNASNFAAGDTNNNGDVFVHDGQTGETRRISVTSTGVQADGFQPAISADGRFVAFVSDAAPLTGRGDSVAEVLLGDRLTGHMTVLSVASGGGRSDGSSVHPTVSADGRFVAFWSPASNLVAGDTNGANDVFVRDVAAQTTARVSVSNDGVQSNSGSGLLSPTISGDGRHVAFSSGASNLVASDTNGAEDIFVVGGVSVTPTTINVPGAGGSRSVNVSFDYPGTPWTATTTTPWITINPPTGGSANATVTFTVAANTVGTARTGAIVVALQTVTVTQSPSSAPVASNLSITTAEDTPLSGTLSAVDPDGDPIAFSVVTAPTRGTVVITNATTGAFTYTPAANRFGGDSFTFQALADGETSNIATVSISVTPVNDAPVAFDGSVDAVEDTTLNGSLFAADDGLAVQFAVVTPPTHGTVTIPGGSVSPLGGSFTYVPAPNFNGTDTFTFNVSDGSFTSNVAAVTIHVAPVDDPPVGIDLFLVTQDGVARNGLLLASNGDGNALTYDLVPAPTKGTVTITDPRTGAFTYTPNANTFGYDAFTVRATAPGGASTTAAVQMLIVAGSPQWRGLTARASVSTAGAPANNTSSLSSISADGRYVAFYSLATNLVPGDTNGFADIFVRDRGTGQTTRVSVSSAGVQGNGNSSDQSLSADGRYVAFVSSASNLVSGDTNGAADVFVHDRQTGQTTRVSVSSSGVQANGVSLRPAISADGRYVVFDSTATNLVTGDTNGVSDVFVHDRLTGQTTRASLSTGGAQGNGSSSVPAISADGRVVSFTSVASNLVAGDTNANNDVFVHDLLTGQTTRVSVASGGGQANDRSVNSHLSADGRHVAFVSFASNLAGGDTSNSSDVFVHDRQTGITTRVDAAANGGQPSAGVSSFFSMSADGRYVAFASYASNLVPGDTNGVADIFVRDVVARQTTRVSLFNGSQAFSSSDAPAISADARFIAYESNGILVASSVAVSPATASFGPAGGSGSVTVSAPYPDIPWSAFTTAPWVALAPPTGGTGSGSIAFTVSATNGAARTGTITVALQPVAVTQDGFVDVTAPTVTPPAPITVYATTPAGATPNLLPAIAAFINGATAIDDGPTAPLQQPPLLNGVVINATTVFPLGADTVLFTFTDTEGNVGTAMSTVTVLAGGPTLSVGLVGTIAAAAGQSATLHVTNTGAGNALGLTVSLTSLRTLGGTGTVALASGLPATVPLLSPGQSFDIPLVINVPTTVTRFAVSESLTMTDYTGAALSTAATQAIFPVDVTAPTVLNNGPVLVPARTSITITWQTSEPATGGVAYGIGTSTNNSLPDDGVYGTSHSATITGLVPNTTYSVIVSGRDRAGNTYTSVRKTVKTSR